MIGNEFAVEDPCLIPQAEKRPAIDSLIVFQPRSDQPQAAAVMEHGTAEFSGIAFETAVDDAQRIA